ncbi:SCO family protein [Anaeromyxobacter diazotrophicus]|uniref:Electron transporter SenC n=1 Tax=Anaeromyxobacter diazotrophicus TaxID=2590199 RepID=A0A7I9VS02_9BACT|nr:SCO family protein [Anaeromyxobacter diazotrophicus]GEJ59048.1 electron transporter SenC [Anaeromyxobacter diazotrophicus]
MRRLAAIALLAPALALALPIGQALHKPVPVEGNAQLPPALQNVEIEEKLGSKLPLDARFTAQDGRAVRLGDLLGGHRPVVLSLVYFDCPMLCGLILTGAARGMRETGLALGKDFDAVTVSFDPRDSTRTAAERQRGYLQAFGDPTAKQAWTFLTGAAPEIKAVTEAVGFKYAWDERSKQFAHAAAIFVLTPDGRVSRYLYGIEFPARDLRLALVEASEGRVGTSFDRLLLTCFRYDPASRKYEPYVMGVVRLAMLGVLGGLGIMLGVFWRREIKAKRVSGGGAGQPTAAHPEDAKR